MNLRNRVVDEMKAHVEKQISKPLTSKDIPNFKKAIKKLKQEGTKR